MFTCCLIKAPIVDWLTAAGLLAYKLILICCPLFSLVASVAGASRALAIIELRILRRSVELLMVAGICVLDGLRMLDVELLTLRVLLGAGGWKLNDAFGIDVLGAVGNFVETLGGLSRGIAGFLNSNCGLVVAGAGAGAGGGMLVTLVTLGGDVAGCFGAVGVVSSTTGSTKPLEEMSERRLVLFDSDLCGLVSIGAMVDSLAVSTSSASFISRVLFRFSVTGSLSSIRSSSS